MDYLANSLPGSRSISLYDSERTYTDPGMYSSKAIEELSSLMILAKVCEAEQQDSYSMNSYQQVDCNEFKDVAGTSKRRKQLLYESNKRWSTGDQYGYNNVHDRFSYNYNNEQHPHHHPVANVYRCCDCDRTFSSFQALGGHRSGRCKELVEYNMDPAEPRQDEVHRCHVCNKTFTSYQALGGHVSSHSKNKNNNNVDRDQCNYTDMSTCTAESKNERQTLYQTVSHQCKVCSKTFPTGQALGGHQRLHYKGPTGAPDKRIQQTSARKHLEIDLNEIPSMEDEDGIYEPSVIL